MVLDSRDIFNNLLSSKGGIKNLDATKATISKVSNQLLNYKDTIRKRIDGGHSSLFIKNQVNSDSYINKGEKLLKETNDVIQKINDETDFVLQDANNELTLLDSELSEAVLGLEISNRIMKIYKLFQRIDEANVTRNLTLVLNLLRELHQLINAEERLFTGIFRKCDCYNSITTKYYVQSHLLKQNLQQNFENLLQLNEKNFQTYKSVTIRISTDDQQLQETLENLFESNFKWDSFSAFLLKNCIDPIIRKPVSIEVLNEKDKYVELRISYSLKDLNKILRPSYKQVLHNLRILLKTLAKLNYKFSNSCHLFSVVGEKVEFEFLSMLVKDCLTFAVPETIEEYKECTLLDDVKDFQNFLFDLCLIASRENCYISQFCENYNSYFNDRFRNKLFEITKEVTAKDLQDMIASDQIFGSEEEQRTTFSPCMVSKSVMELIKVLEHIIRQPVVIKEWEEEKFVFKVVSMSLNTYINEIPKIHKKLLESIPQQAALFYNNCLLLSHWFAEILEINDPSLNKSLNETKETGKLFLDMQVSSQTEIIMDILKEFELAEDGSLGQLPMKLARQIMRQLDLLGNVWQNVLPDEIYNSTFCDIVDNICRDLTRRVMSIEDMSATLANELSILIDIVLERGPLLFKEKHMVVHIKTWAKLEQLRNILNASLQQIVDLWCNGVGPLSLNFKAEEIRFLIRALFQNTDKRAHAISKIV